MSATDHSYKYISPVVTPPTSTHNGVDEQERTLWVEKSQALGRLIQSWLDDEESTEEQRETLACIMQALDEDRLSDRKLFP